jgi:hypothetical protein
MRRRHKWEDDIIVDGSEVVGCGLIFCGSGLGTSGGLVIHIWFLKNARNVEAN